MKTHELNRHHEWLLAILLCIAALVMGCAGFAIGQVQGQPTETDSAESASELTDPFPAGYRATYMHARLLWANGQAREALGVLEPYLDDPRAPERLYATAVEILLQAQNRDQARDVLEQGLQAHPDSIRLTILQAMLLRDEGEVGRAIASIEQSLEHQPGRQILLEVLSELYLSRMMQRSQESEGQLHADIRDLIGVYERMLETREGLDKMVPLLALSSLYSQLKEFDRATEVAREAVELRPNAVHSLMALGGALEAAGRHDEALETYRRALLNHPTHSELYDRLRLLLSRRFDLQQRIDFFYNLAAEHPERSEIQAIASRGMAEMLAQAGRQDSLQTAVDQAMSLAARKGEVAMVVVLAFVDSLDQRGHEEMAIQLLQQLHDQHPDDFFTTALLVEAHGRQERYLKAHELLDDLTIELNDEQQAVVDELRTMLFLNQGIKYQLDGQHQEAETLYRKALALSPQDAETYNTLGYFLAETNQNLDEALELVNKALELKPGAGHIIDSLGWIYYQMGRYEEALDQLQKAVELLPRDAELVEVLIHLGDTYEKLGRVEEARETWQEAAELDQGAWEQMLQERLQRVGAEAEIPADSAAEAP